MSDHHAIGLRVEPELVQLAPGTSALLQATVENRGQVVDRISLSIHGVDADWATLSTSSLDLFPGEQASVDIRLSAPVAPLARADMYPVRLRVTSTVEPTASAEAVASLEVLSVGSVHVRLSPRIIGARAGGQARLILDNDSNADQGVGLRFEDPEDALEGELAQSHVALTPGEQRQVSLSITPRRRPLFAPPRRYPFSVAATRESVMAQELIVEVPGELLYESPLAWLADLLGGGARLARGLMVPLMLAAVAIYALGSPGGRDMAAGLANRASEAGLSMPVEVAGIGHIVASAPAGVVQPTETEASASAPAQAAGLASPAGGSAPAGAAATGAGAVAKPAGAGAANGASPAAPKPGGADQAIAALTGGQAAVAPAAAAGAASAAGGAGGAGAAASAPVAGQTNPADSAAARDAAAQHAAQSSASSETDRLMQRLPTLDEAVQSAPATASASASASETPYVAPATVEPQLPLEIPATLPPIIAAPLPNRPAVEAPVEPTIPPVVVEDGKIDDGGAGDDGPSSAPGSSKPRYMWCYWGDDAQLYRLDLCTSPVLVCPPSAAGDRLCEVPPPVPCTDSTSASDLPCQRLWIICPDGTDACIPKPVAWPPAWEELVTTLENPDPLILAEIDQLKRQSLRLMELEEMARQSGSVAPEQLLDQRRRLMEAFILADWVRFQAELDGLGALQVGRVLEQQLRGTTGLVFAQERELTDLTRPSAPVSSGLVQHSAPQTSVQLAPTEATTLQQAPLQTTVQQAPAQTATQLAPSQTTVQQAPTTQVQQAPAAPAQTATQLAPSQTTVQQAPAQTTTQLAPAQTTVQQAPTTQVQQAPAAPAQTATQLAPSQTTVQQAPAQTATQLAPAQTTVQQAPTTQVQQAPAAPAQQAPAAPAQQAPSAPVQQAPSQLERAAVTSPVQQQAPAAPVQQAPATIDRSSQLRNAPAVISLPGNDAAVSKPAAEIQRAPVNRVAGP